MEGGGTSLLSWDSLQALTYASTSQSELYKVIYWFKVITNIYKRAHTIQPHRMCMRAKNQQSFIASDKLTETRERGRSSATQKK